MKNQKSPKWCYEELKLVLLLYIKKGYEWQRSISDKTPEIISMSNILKGLDCIKESRPESFRSPSSVRLKLANFKSVDPEYSKSSLSNVAKNDKEVWDSFSKDFDKLKEQCIDIIKNHLSEEIYKTEKEFICYLCGELSFKKSKNDVLNVITLLKSEHDKYKDIMDVDLVIEGLEKVVFEIEKDDFQYKTHAGINLKPIKSKGKKQVPKEIVVLEKIGEHVRNTIKSIIDNNQLTESLIDRLQEASYCKEQFHLGHPFLVKIKTDEDIREQLKDQNGFVRYWVTPVIIRESTYCICKEWYESNRKYYDAWLEKLINGNKLICDFEKFRQIISYIQKIDQERIYIRKDDVIKKYGKESEQIIAYMIKEGILTKYQDNNNMFVIEEYDDVFDMMEHPEKYCM